MLPEKFLNRMAQMLKEEYPRFLQSYDDGKCCALRLNPLKCETDRFLEQSPFRLRPVPWCQEGFYYEEDDRPGRHPFHDAGVYYIQDASAMAPVVYLKPRPGEKILDLCGAPGGKSTQIGAAMKNQGIFITNEIHPARARILSENMERMGIQNGLVTNETPQKLAKAFGEYFDGILVDAPCSGEGMFRKNDEACKEWSTENVKLCGDRQDEILECAAEMLAPGGRIVYSTCTFAPWEDEGTVSRFLKSHPEFSLVPMKQFDGMAFGVPQWASWTAEGEAAGGGAVSPEDYGPLAHTIRLWPHRLKGEGHFAAVLYKEGAPAKRREPDRQKGLKETEYREYADFQKEYLTEPLNGIFVKFGEQLYLLPEGTPSLKGLRVLRPGLHLGTIKKNRFQPSHALAVALKTRQVTHTRDFSAQGEEIKAYLRGETLAADGEKGWYLITVSGYSVGWGKLSGGIMKNHYPKGLRKA